MEGAVRVVYGVVELHARVVELPAAEAAVASHGERQHPAPIILHKDRVAQGAEVLVLVERSVRRVVGVVDEGVLAPGLALVVARDVHERAPLLDIVRLVICKAAAAPW